jgi:hypothetical protein
LKKFRRIKRSTVRDSLDSWPRTARLCLICIVMSIPVYLAMIGPGDTLTLLITRH